MSAVRRATPASRANLPAPERGPEERAKETEVEDTRRDRHQPDDGNDDAASAADSPQAEANERQPRDDAPNAPTGPSDQLGEGGVGEASG